MCIRDSFSGAINLPISITSAAIVDGVIGEALTQENLASLNFVAVADNPVSGTGGNSNIDLAGTVFFEIFDEISTTYTAKSQIECEFKLTDNRYQTDNRTHFNTYQSQDFLFLIFSQELHIINSCTTSYISEEDRDIIIMLLPLSDSPNH